MSPLTTFDAGAWWSPVTALLVPDSAIEALLMIALILTVMAYAERKLGTAAGILLGIGLESLLTNGDMLWGLSPDTGFVVDPGERRLRRRHGRQRVRPRALRAGSGSSASP